jgi:hypothetical protein
VTLQVRGVVNGEVNVHVWPPGEAVTVYEVIEAPPLFTGAANVTVALPSPAVAVTPVTGSGFVVGVAELPALTTEVPLLFVAVAVKV